MALSDTLFLTTVKVSSSSFEQMVFGMLDYDPKKRGPASFSLLEQLPKIIIRESRVVTIDDIYARCEFNVILSRFQAINPVTDSQRQLATSHKT